MPAGGRERHQPRLASNPGCWEPAQSSLGSQGCLGTAGQCLSLCHPCMMPSFLRSSPLLAGLRTPAPGGLAAARCRAEPRHRYSGDGPRSAPALGASLGPGEPCVTLRDTLECPQRCQGWALQGFTRSPDVFTVAACLALISSNTLINCYEGCDSRIQPNEVPWENIPGSWSTGIAAAAAVASTQVLQCLQSLRAAPALCSRTPNSHTVPMAWSGSQQWA